MTADRTTMFTEAAERTPTEAIDRGPEPRIGERPERTADDTAIERRADRGPEPRLEPDVEDRVVDQVRPAMQTVDDAFPGLYDRSDCAPPTETDSLRPPDDWVTDRNPGYPDAPGRRFNCGDCTRASELTWRGLDTQAGALADPDAVGEGLAVMDRWSPGERTPTDVDGVKTTLEELGPGSSAVVAIYWKDGGGTGHWFNAFNDAGVVKATDSQIGRSEMWPPTIEGLGFDEDDISSVEAIFVDSNGRHRHDDME